MIVPGISDNLLRDELINKLVTPVAIANLVAFANAELRSGIDETIPSCSYNAPTTLPLQLEAALHENSRWLRVCRLGAPRQDGWQNQTCYVYIKVLHVHHCYPNTIVFASLNYGYRMFIRDIPLQCSWVNLKVIQPRPEDILFQASNPYILEREI